MRENYGKWYKSVDEFRERELRDPNAVYVRGSVHKKEREKYLKKDNSHLFHPQKRTKMKNFETSWYRNSEVNNIKADFPFLRDTAIRFFYG